MTGSITPPFLPTERTQTRRLSDAEVRESVQWLADLALTKLPASYKGDKDWGRQKQVWAGVDMKRDGLKLRTHRKYRDVNHGRWFRYEVTPRPHAVSPTAAGPPGGAPQSSVNLEILRVRQSDDAWLIDASVNAPLDFTTQVQRWNLGLKWYSVSTNGDMRVRVNLTVKVRFTTDYQELPPALVIDPEVVDAKLVLEQFDIDRVSKIGGEVAEEIGVVVERNLKRFWIDKLNDKLSSKLNRSIDKHRDDLRLSLTSYFEGIWN
ncbi:MAG: hypothetical protein AAF989_05980 [Planctomycetota bacterium]